MIHARRTAEAGGDGRWHSPDRDLAYAWPSLVRAAMDQLATENWRPWFAEYFKFAGVTEEDIGRAAEAYARYFRFVCAPGVDDPRRAFELAGWFDLPLPAQVALFMKLGQVCSLAFFACIRDVTPENAEPPVDARALYAAAMNARFVLAARPRWVRWVARQWAYLRSHVWPFRRRGGGA